MAKKYKVIKGDSLWKIAKDNNISLDELIKLNPTKKNMIHPGDELRLEPDKIKETVDIRAERQRESRFNLDNVSAIQGYKHNSNYVIVDKKNRKLTVYDKDNNELYSTNDISFGKSGNDYNTVTYRGNSGIENYGGNNSTPAGITQITSTGEYHGAPSFTRGRVNNQNEVGKVKEWKKDENGKWYQSDNLVDDNIASSFHIGNTASFSNGCVRIGKQSLKDMTQFLGVGDRVYTLPEKEGSRFVLKGGKLNFTADNPYGNYTKDDISESGHSMENWDDYNTTIDRSYTPLKLTWTNTGDYRYDTNRKNFAQSIVNNKKQLQKEFGLTSDEYNHLAELALGLAEQESKFGTAYRYSMKQRLGEGMIQLIKGTNHAISRGYTQIKNKGDNKELQAIYSKLGIDNNSIKTAGGSAIATIARLAHMYNTEVKGRTFTNQEGITINPYHALLYKWNGHNEQLTNHTATPENNVYIRNVNNYSRRFNLYETREYDKYKLGGRLSIEGDY